MNDPGELFELGDVTPKAAAGRRDSRAAAMRRHRNTFRTHRAPTEPMSKFRTEWFPPSSNGLPSPAEAAIMRWFEDQADSRDRFRWALRDSLDEVLDGQRTGR